MFGRKRRRIATALHRSADLRGDKEPLALESFYEPQECVPSEEEQWEATGTLLTLGQSSTDPPVEIIDIHVDHLGSTRLTTGDDGSIVTEHDFMPFGEEILATPDVTTKMFTGHERDSGTGLDYMLARYYSNQTGRFLSVDPLGASARPELSQSWNRYAYVLNNPIAWTDPTGLVDDRDDADKAILDDPDVVAANQKAWDETNSDAPPDDRQEVGFIVTDEGGGDFGATETITQGNPLNVELPAIGDETQVIMEGPNKGEKAAADVYAQPGANTQPVDPETGQRVSRPLGIGPSRADEQTTTQRNVPAYTIGKKKMWRTRPGEKAKLILSKGEFREYMGRSK